MGYFLQKLHTATFLCFCDNRIPLCKHSNLHDFHKNHVTEIRITRAEYWKNIFWFTKILVKSTIFGARVRGKVMKTVQNRFFWFWRFASKNNPKKDWILTISKMQKRYLGITRGLKSVFFTKKHVFRDFWEPLSCLLHRFRLGSKIKLEIFRKIKLCLNKLI